MACDPAEVEALVAAVNTSPTPANVAALFSFLESQTGQSMEELVGDSWAELIADGETRETTIVLSDCNVRVNLTLGGEFVGTTSCDYLQTMPPISFGQNDFDLAKVVTNTATHPVGSSEVYIRQGDIQVHLENPEFVYLETFFDGGGADQALVSRLGRIGQTSNLGSITLSGADPPTYYPFYRVKGSYTCKIEEVSASTSSNTTHTFRVRPPLMGFRRLLAQQFDTSPDPEFLGRLISDPLDLGENTWGNAFEAGIDYTAEDSELPYTSGSAGGMGPQARQSVTYWPATFAIGEPTSTDPYPLWASNSITKTLAFLADSNSASGETTQDAWDDFIAAVEDYQAFASIYDPEVELDVENMEVRVSFNTNLNACYLPLLSCNDNLNYYYNNPVYQAWTMSWGGYWQDLGWVYQASTPAAYRDPVGGITGFPSTDNISGPHTSAYESPHDRWLATSATRANTNYPEDNFGYAMSSFIETPMPRLAGEYNPTIEAATYSNIDAKPPTVTPNPPLIKPKPVSGACKASIDGPSSCNFNIPIEPDPDSPDFPMPGDFVEPEIPDIPMPEMPVLDVELPVMPPIDCLLPDFGNLAGCPPGPGSGSLPGGRDRKGRRGSGVGGIKTGGPTYGIRDPTFNQDFPDGTIDPGTGEPIIPPTRSFPAGSSVMTAITIILLDLGLSPLNIVFEIGPEWDKTFGPKTFPETTRMFDAAQWLASLIMCKIIDEGDGNVYIGPPTHRPGQNTWTFNSQFPNVDGEPPMLGLGYGASMGEAFYAVEVWGAHLGTSVFALVDTPFSVDPNNILQIEVGPDYSLAEAQDLAAFRAGLIRRDAVMVQVEVPYSQQMFMRDKLVLKFPDRGLQWEYIIFAKQSEISLEKRVNILTGVLPATLEELENFPDVMDEGMNAVDMGFA